MLIDVFTLFEVYGWVDAALHKNDVLHIGTG